MTLISDSDLNGPRYSATLLRSVRMTAEHAREDVRELRFRLDAPGFSGHPGQLVRVRAPGQFGNAHHVRLYSLADVDAVTPDRVEMTLVVRRCFVIDDFNGEQYAGVASNYLCDLPIGARIEFTGPVGYPFKPPADPHAHVLMIGMGTGIAPFRGLVRQLYEQVPRWMGQVRLFYGARSGLEMLYMNDANHDLAIYFDQPTFKAFQAFSPRPALAAPVALDVAIEQHAAEVWELLQADTTHVFIAGPQAMLTSVQSALGRVAGSAQRGDAVRRQLVAAGRWHDVLY